MPAAAYLRPYLLALWGQATEIAELPASPSARAILGDGLLLVPGPSATATVSQQREVALATAAHAGAHVRYGQGLHERGSLKPVQVALLGLLEDARVECLAASELPGLRALWLRFHQADQTAGSDVEALFLRLSHSLLDPDHDDPHAWVRKGRGLFYSNGVGTTSALPDRAGLRRAASLLGNDLGQMRLQFSARSYEVKPAYRDDNTHLWSDRIDSPAQQRAADVSRELTTGTPAPPPVNPSAFRRDTRYPEWDRLIHRLRADWVTVRELDETRRPQPGDVVRHLQRTLDRNRSIARRLRGFLAGRLMAAPASGPHAAEHGDDLHLDAIVATRIALRLGHARDMRIHLCTRPGFERLSVLTMLDASASTARTAGAGGGTVLQAGRLASLLLAGALEQAHHESSLQAFSSNGRDQVIVQPIKRFEECASDPLVLSRAAVLTSRWSTRMGAALRHATAAASRRQARRKVVLLVTDGEPHDIDVHDSRYLLADLRQAVRESLRHDVRVGCVNLGAAPSSGGQAGELHGAFAPGAYRELAGWAEFPRAVADVLRCALERVPRP